MKNIFMGIFLLMVFPETVSACPLCREQVAASVFNLDFDVHFFLTLLPIFVVMAMGSCFHFVDDLMNIGWGRRW